MNKENKVENDKMKSEETLKDTEDKVLNENEINCNSKELNDLINSFNSGDNDFSELINTFSKGDIGNVVKQFTDIISTNSKPKSQSSANSTFDNLSDKDEDITEVKMNKICEETEDDDFEGDFELDLDKYFISKDGTNICDVLSDIKNELKDIKNKL